MPSKPHNIAVIGYGLSAKVFHIPLILALPSHFNLYAIVQRSPKPDNDASKDHPNAKIYHSFDDAISDSAIDLVVLSTIPETHFPMAKAALEADKNVIVEKPFVPTAVEATQLITIAQRVGKLLGVYQNRRYDADYNTVAHLIKSGQLGEVAEFETHFDRHRPSPPADSWKGAQGPGHGALYDLGSHLIDQVYHLFGLPKTVTAFVGTQRRGILGGAAADSFTVLLHYDGMLVTAKAGVISPEAEQLRFWVRGTRGSYKKYHLDPQEDQLKAGTVRPGDEGFGVEDAGKHGTLSTVVDNKVEVRKYATAKTPTYVGFYRDFAGAMEGKMEVPVGAGEARDVLRVIEAALRSSEEGRTVAL